MMLFSNAPRSPPNWAYLLQNRPSERLQFGAHQAWGRVENGFSDALWTFRVQSDAIRPYPNAPTIFQHMMNDIFREYLDHFVFIYLDDILVLSSTFEEHTHHVWLVLTKLQEYGLFAKSEKCEFDRTSVEFLGYIIPPTRITMDERKVAQSLIGLSRLGWKRYNHFLVLQIFIDNS